MKRFALLAFLLTGCGASRAETETIRNEDLVGTWQVEARLDGKDSVVTRYVLTVDDAHRWELHFPGVDVPVRPQVTISTGDSIITRTAPYPSTLRPGVMVRTEGVFRLVDGKLIGRSTARYSGNGPDSVRRVNTIGVRVSREVKPLYR